MPLFIYNRTKLTQLGDMAKILIAEDDESMLNFLTLALKRAGHEVCAEKNGNKALSAFDEDNGYDLLLTDIVMPGIDGIELAKKVTQKSPKTKVMFITGFAGMALESPDSLEAQKTATMSKPFHLNDLVEHVEDLLKAE